MEPHKLCIWKSNCFRHVVYLYLTSLLLSKFVASLVIKEELPRFECLEGFVGVKSIPEEFIGFLDECNFDKTQPEECKKHCMAKKLGLILDGKIWTYKLAVVLKTLFPGQRGKDAWDKMIDVILECTDRHYKAFGPMTPFHCYREKKMWACVVKGIDTVCQNNHRHIIESQRTRDPGKKDHHDQVVDDTEGEPLENEGEQDPEEEEESGPKKHKEVIMKDY